MQPSTSIATATSERLVSPEVAASMDLLSRGFLERLPSDYDESAWVRERVTRELVIAPDGHVPIRFMPDAFREFVRPIEEQHFEAALRVVGLTRWVYGMPGRPQPLAATAQEFARPNEGWIVLPYEQPKPARPYITTPAFADDSEVKSMQELLDSGATESVARSLWLEASVLRYTNPRSSLVAAVAAAEIGLKDALRAHGYKPKKKNWPPLQNLLGEDLLPLTLQATVPLGIPVMIPKSLRDAIRSAIRMRNALAHEGVFDLNNEQIDALLDAVENFIWLMDFYRGYRWAITKVDALVLGDIARSGGFATPGDLVRAVLAARRT